jgi:hypothetical protein
MIGAKKAQETQKMNQTPLTILSLLRLFAANF